LMVMNQKLKKFIGTYLHQFFKPLTNKKRPEGGFFNKNKFTTEWTDFFTNDASNDKSNDAQFITDPESFGITKIDIKNKRFFFTNNYDRIYGCAR
jgi:hypothetical protein